MKWVESWKVESTTGKGSYTVSRTAEDEYGCDCPVWKFKRRECKHISIVKAGGGGTVDVNPVESTSTAPSKPSRSEKIAPENDPLEKIKAAAKWR